MYLFTLQNDVVHEVQIRLGESFVLVNYNYFLVVVDIIFLLWISVVISLMYKTEVWTPFTRFQSWPSPRAALWLVKTRISQMMSIPYFLSLREFTTISDSVWVVGWQSFSNTQQDLFNIQFQFANICLTSRKLEDLKTVLRGPSSESWSQARAATF